MLGLKSYLVNKDGNFGIMFALTVSMIGFGVAAAIDVSAMHGAKEDLQNNLDSAALAAVIEVAQNGIDDGNEGDGNDESYYKAVILESLETHGYNVGAVDPTVVIENGSLWVETTRPLNLMFGGLLNKSSVNVTASTQVALPSSSQPVEIALVLDNTNSMNPNGKLTALRMGANEFIDAIEESNSGSKIAIVPFARYVAVGEDKRGEPWLEVPAEFDTNRTWQQGTHTGGTCQIETQTRWRDGFEEEFDVNVCTGQTTTYETMSAVHESRWIGCVGVRSGGLHMTDGPYTSSETRIQGLLHKIPHEVVGAPIDVESWCPRRLTPLTDDYGLLRTEISELYGTDSTYIPAGLIWGRRVLSSEEPFMETDTVNPKKKIMVLMTDGLNTSLLDTSATSVSEYTAPPYVRGLTADEQEAGVVATQANDDTASLCDVIKAEDTELYTIAFQVTDPVTLSLLQNCASTGRHYFNAESNEALVETFREISTGVGGDIRLMR